MNGGNGVIVKSLQLTLFSNRPVWSTTSGFRKRPKGDIATLNVQDVVFFRWVDFFGVALAVIAYSSLRYCDVPYPSIFSQYSR